MEFWTDTLRRIYDQAIERYRAGDRGADTFFSREDTAFLASIGLKPINVYDYAEDFASSGVPGWETFLLTMAARRDYFLFEQKGVPCARVTEERELPVREAELGGIAWLPRIIAKARCFLAGGLCEDIMYGCGGDRRFLQQHGRHPADFLRVVWAARGDDDRILAFVRDPLPGGN